MVENQYCPSEISTVGQFSLIAISISLDQFNVKIYIENLIILSINMRIFVATVKHGVVSKSTSIALATPIRAILVQIHGFPAKVAFWLKFRGVDSLCAWKKTSFVFDLQADFIIVKSHTHKQYYIKMSSQNVWHLAFSADEFDAEG